MATALPSQDFDPLYFDVPSFLDNAEGPAFHGFFGRQGGVSKDVYATLNCGIGSDDEPDHVKRNLARIAEIAGIKGTHLLSLHQEHKDICLRVERPWEMTERPKADAYVSDVPGIGLGILTADCAPVLFYGEALGRPVVGAAHAGWRGALKGVLERTIEAMVKLGAESADIKACIGPCIGRDSYEVKEDFAMPFLDEDHEHEKYFRSARRPGHYMFDLAGYCAGKLYKAGLSRIYIKDLDTYFNEEDFFSCRRAAHRKEKDYGRQMAVICIKQA